MWTKAESIKELDDPESMRDLRIVFGSISVVREIKSESGSERVDVPSVAAFVRGSSVQSSGHMELQGLLSLFLHLSWKAWALKLTLGWFWLHVLWQQLECI